MLLVESEHLELSEGDHLFTISKILEIGNHATIHSLFKLFSFAKQVIVCIK